MGRFDLDHLENDECVAEFRFQKVYIYDLPGALQIPDEIVCYYGTKLSDIKALCIFLKRHAYPCPKKVYAIKFQSAAATNVLIANLFVPVEGRRHDRGMLGGSGLLRKL